ncbi:MarR family winged helix-turn-helix transcriptional regulator [Kribbella monticola]|jgi:DNA-binding MarR family transcriptional regulator|uniref:MarR family winged helix-turn-helix transcriptional regulator n=1 Tax=Kribbella monticola TaxID=2185285 RepID=UPI000DD490ED|nr:MarR family transcriptional regulator [Kribbella monticola]
MGDDEVRWLKPDELQAWMTLAGLMFKLPAALDVQLQRDSGLTHFEYLVLAGLSESPERSRPMSDLAGFANGSLSRLSHVVKRLEQRGFVRRCPSPADGRITVATLTDAGYEELVAAAPGHVATVRQYVIDALTPEQLSQLKTIGDQILQKVDPGRAC